MSLTKPNQQLRRDLKAAASALDDAAHDLFREAKSYAEPEFLIAMAKIENCGTAFRIAEQKTKGLHEESHASP